MATPTQEMPPELAVAETPAKSAAPVQRTIHTAQLVTAMLKANTQVSDLIFSPGRAPQIEVNGQLVELKFKGLECLTTQDTSFIAYDIDDLPDDVPLRPEWAGYLEGPPAGAP